ncbi:lyase [Pseudomonas taiwanensis]|uniref:Vgb family protein n=1 Tax=Pseudomonas taiwanensis TaxID=470150 RepID=UPI0015C102CA|nr:lyase [Pseudomonas taiwanensis]NWL75785.1 lyase [Pseudomonas taiwanensis]
MIRPYVLALCAALFCATATAAEVTYYPVPTGTGPRDVAPATDGRVWFTAQRLGSVGLLDPLTGETQLITLGVGSSPRALVVDQDGAAWITDAGLDALVRVDPLDRSVRTFPLKGSTTGIGLEGLAMDRNGNLWFTGQKGFFGRFRPASDSLQIWPAPGGPGPNGITVTPNGEVWYANETARHIGRIDPESGTPTLVDVPEESAGPRLIWSDSRGTLWVGEAGSGRLSRFDPLGETWSSWDIPGNNADAHALYVDEQERVWLSDYRANAILRFNPFSRIFASFPSDRPAARVTHLSGRTGEVWGAESAQDRLVMIRY